MTAELLATVQKLERIVNIIMSDITCQCGKLDLQKKNCVECCDHIWNPKHSSGFVVCEKCEKVYTEAS